MPASCRRLARRARRRLLLPRAAQWALRNIKRMPRRRDEIPAPAAAPVGVRAAGRGHEDRLEAGRTRWLNAPLSEGGQQTGQTAKSFWALARGRPPAGAGVDASAAPAREDATHEQALGGGARRPGPETAAWMKRSNIACRPRPEAPLQREASTRHVYKADRREGRAGRSAKRQRRGQRQSPRGRCAGAGGREPASAEAKRASGVMVQSRPARRRRCRHCRQRAHWRRGGMTGGGREC